MPAKAKLVKLQHMLIYLFVRMLLIGQKPVTEHFPKYCILIGKQKWNFCSEKVCVSLCALLQINWTHSY